MIDIYTELQQIWKRRELSKFSRYSSISYNTLYKILRRGPDSYSKRSEKRIVTALEKFKVRGGEE